MGRSRHKRNQQVSRQWRILLALSDREWFSINEVRACLPEPPHKRTIMRDLEGLSEVFPIERRIWGEGPTGEQYQYRLRRPLKALLAKSSTTFRKSS